MNDVEFLESLLLYIFMNHKHIDGIDNPVIESLPIDCLIRERIFERYNLTCADINEKMIYNISIHNKTNIV